MENIENSLLENITPPQAETSFFTKLKGNCPALISIGIVSIAIISFVFYAIYSYGKRGQEIQPIPTVTVTPLPTSALTPAISPTPQDKEWRSFRGSNIEYSIQYPTDWVISEEFDSDGISLLYFSIKNGTYELKYNPPHALTGICVFNDDDEEELKAAFEEDFPGYYDQGRIKLGDYVEFGEYRRAEYKSAYKEGQFIVCKGNIETGFSYVVPIEYDESIVLVMDKMVNSFEWIDGQQL